MTADTFSQKIKGDRLKDMLKEAYGTDDESKWENPDDIRVIYHDGGAIYVACHNVYSGVFGRTSEDVDTRLSFTEEKKIASPCFRFSFFTSKNILSPQSKTHTHTRYRLLTANATKCDTVVLGYIYPCDSHITNMYISKLCFSASYSRPRSLPIHKRVRATAQHGVHVSTRFSSQ